MAGGITDALEISLADRAFGSAAYTPPANVHVGGSTTRPTDAGANVTEPSGGAYARVSKTNDATRFPSGSLKQLAEDVQFPIATASWGRLKWATFHTASTAGTLMGYMAMTDAQKRAFNDLTDVITCKSHGFAANDPIRVLAYDGGSVPTGLTDDEIYYARDITTDTFKLAASAGGAAIDLTSVEMFEVAYDRSKVIDTDDRLTFSANQLQLQFD
jgi:hypothetical protein